MRAGTTARRYIHQRRTGVSSNAATRIALVGQSAAFVDPPTRRCRLVLALKKKPTDTINNTASTFAESPVIADLTVFRDAEREVTNFREASTVSARLSRRDDFWNCCASSVDMVAILCRARV